MLSPEGIVGGTIVALAALARTVLAILEVRTTRRFQQKVRSIPPSDPPPARDSSDDEAMQAEIRQSEQKIYELEMQLTEVGRDHGHTARDLTREREETAMLKARVVELEAMLRAMGATPTRPTIDIPIDERPTPKQGMRRVRRK